ncbi:hypothetical protein [Aneurinibacillus migulanus]|uniref:Uncharacterized protein n=1 Tax=Aneurinibacillus migulanus TaxID=47500 RepID=A0A0D1VDL9_ANEMI|nr:hypothetical protein [Aneurinibacillus migulanus]KIV57524.1 hypothetical protein TS65_09905 [Aneurinibacillus migulanus]KON94858.1 hypothetical protein AF333_04520 [Aneurinibacillus migulanus]MED0892880.1 hypothetical protein [Aneurinibacillus migulanus]MED1619126.1 hypothetical protein [Aneurinibacillus migulanus]SDI91747.1 hypothetical protein SAMN04487909_10984 [Aneurinibacillus migulanus]
MKAKIFKFSHSEGAEIIAASNAKEAIMFFFTQYADDIQMDDMVEFGGIEITELKGENITKKHSVFDESKNETVSVSYQEIATISFVNSPVVLVSPSY